MLRAGERGASAGSMHSMGRHRARRVATQGQAEQAPVAVVIWPFSPCTPDLWPHVLAHARARAAAAHRCAWRGRGRAHLLVGEGAALRVARQQQPLDGAAVQLLGVARQHLAHLSHLLQKGRGRGIQGAEESRSVVRRKGSVGRCGRGPRARHGPHPLLDARGDLAAGVHGLVEGEGPGVKRRKRQQLRAARGRQARGLPQRVRGALFLRARRQCTTGTPLSLPSPLLFTHARHA